MSIQNAVEFDSLREGGVLYSDTIRTFRRKTNGVINKISDLSGTSGLGFASSIGIQEGRVHVSGNLTVLDGITLSVGSVNFTSLSDIPVVVNEPEYWDALVYDSDDEVFRNEYIGSEIYGPYDALVNENGEASITVKTESRNEIVVQVFTSHYSSYHQTDVIELFVEYPDGTELLLDRSEYLSNTGPLYRETPVALMASFIPSGVGDYKLTLKGAQNPSNIASQSLAGRSGSLSVNRFVLMSPSAITLKSGISATNWLTNPVEVQSDLLDPQNINGDRLQRLNDITL